MTPQPATSYLPEDFQQALLVGRVWRRAGRYEGPSVVIVRNGEVVDVTASVPTTADLFDRDDLVQFARTVKGEALGSVVKLMEAMLRDGEGAALRLLAPNDVQAIKHAASRLPSA